MIELDKIYNEDCLIGMQRIPNGTIDAVICDLPYGTSACAWDSVIPFDKLWEQYKRIIKPDGNIVLFASGRFVFELYASQPKLYRYDLIWQKSRCGSPLTSPYMPLKMHEHILVFGRSAAKYNPQMTTGGTPYHKDYDHAYGIKNNHKYGVKGIHTDNHGERHPISVLKFDQKWRRQDQIHPTQKPIPLLQWLVKTYTNEGDTVLDNCSGSGSTAMACVKEKRHFICFEKDENYWRQSIVRVKNELCQPTLF